MACKKRRCLLVTTVLAAPARLRAQHRGAEVVGDAVVVAGGGPQMGGAGKSAISEAFSLA